MFLTIILFVNKNRFEIKRNLKCSLCLGLFCLRSIFSRQLDRSNLFSTFSKVIINKLNIDGSVCCNIYKSPEQEVHWRVTHSRFVRRLRESEKNRGHTQLIFERAWVSPRVFPPNSCTITKYAIWPVNDKD